ncbi:MAG: polysaccharide biosynthesis C-terminal domain-containing protein, partial [Oscillospiraceae bacterium]
PNVISWWILNASDRTIILKFLGVAANGIYSAANKFSGIYATIFNIFNLSWTETVALHFKEDNASKDFNQLQSYVIRFFSCMFLGITAVMPLVFKILVNERYAQAYFQIPPLLMGAFFSAMTGVIGAYYVAEKMTTVIAKMTFLSAVLNVVINLALVNQFGLFAASFSTLLSYLIVFVMRYFDVKKRFGIKIEMKLIFSTLIMTAVIWFTYYRANTIECGIVLVLVVIYSVYMNKFILKSVIKLIIEKFSKKHV